MPRSKRNKQVELSKTKKRDLEWKKQLFEKVRNCVDTYANVFVFSVSDMRNTKMRNVRNEWKHSRFFIGKNRIMAMALGRFEEEEYKPNLHKLGQQIKGQCGLLFSNKPVDEVLSWFRSFSEGDYARSGNTAIETVNLSAGPLTMFPHNLEPYLRQLGLPTSLVKGMIHLVKDHEVCKAGDTLTPETAKILKMLGYQMAEFHITIDCVWSQDGSFLQLTEKVESDTKENFKKGKKISDDSKVSEIKTNSPVVEKMEVVDLDDENDSDISEDENDSDISEDENNNTPDINSANAQEEKSSDLKENFQSEFQQNPENKINTVEALNINGNESADISEETESNVRECGADVIEKTSSDIRECEADVIEETSSDIRECGADVIEETSSDIRECGADDNVNMESSARKESISRRKSSKAKKKKISLPKTPDANTSQDSPVFRQLRNRSVKFSSKKIKK